MADCVYPKCYNCELEWCIKDKSISPNLPSIPVDRTEYHKEYYQKHKEEIKAKYQSKTRYLKYVAVRSAINKLKKQIGEVNYNLVISEIEKIEKECLER